MRRSVKGGGTRRSHLEIAAKRNSWAAAQLKSPPFPEALRYLWNDYQQLAIGSVHVGPAGIEPITWQDVQSWLTCLQRTVEPHEVEALLAIDAVMRTAMKSDDTSEPDDE